MAKAKIKPVWIVCAMTGQVLCDDNNVPQEFKSERAAIKQAGKWTQKSADDEAWVFRLTHIVLSSGEYKDV